MLDVLIGTFLVAVGSRLITADDLAGFFNVDVSHHRVVSVEDLGNLLESGALGLDVD